MDIERFRPSRFTHFLPVEEGHTALYNSLNMGIIFVSNKELSDLQKNNWSTGKKAPESRRLLEKLREEKLLVNIEYDEMGDVRKVKESLRNLPIAILYLLLTDQCNFNCRYCFVGGGVPREQKAGWMTPEVAKEGIDLFAKTLPRNPQGRYVDPRVIFYGGEPLLNFKTMQFALEYIDALKAEGVLSENLRVTLNTNASMVNEEVAWVLAKHGVAVAVSLDGRKDVHDKERVSRSGKGTFDQTMRGFHLLKKHGVSVSISCTVTESGVDRLEDSLTYFINELGIRAVGFNIAREGAGPGHKNPQAYAEAASEALIRCFKIAREKGVYEDRMMRKARALIKRKPHVNDCAACGQQIVIAPTGEVGICHAAVKSKTYFVAHTPELDPQTHPSWTEWRKRSPFNMPECLDCVALGICGGGCPYEVYLKEGTIWKIDKEFCIHSKMSLEFLIQDLWGQIKIRRTNI